MGSFVFGAATLAVLLSIAYAGKKSDGHCIPSDREALLSFKADLIDRTNQLSSWVEQPGDCCVWSGVLCHNSTGHVLELHLGSMGLVLGASNTMNPSLLNLKQLTYLDFRGIDFKGIQIPGFLGSLENMRYLDLSDARFGGMIPHQLGNLSNLQYLNLRSNSFSSVLVSDSLKWVSNLFSLQYLDLSGSDLSRATDWLQVTNALPSLQELYLSSCRLNHTLPSPPALNNNSALSVLDLSLNRLDFSFSPPWTSNLQGLTSLSLRSNHFGGPFPPGLQNSTSLRFLDLSRCAFTSSIPDWVFNFNQLRVLDVSFNSMQGRVPEGIQNLTSLATLDLYDNSLVFGQFRELIDNSKNLTYLDLSGCSMSGSIPDSIGTLSSLTYLSVRDNRLVGPIPESIGRLWYLKELHLRNNLLNGSLPKSLGQLMLLEKLSISHNPLKGDVTEAHFGNLSSLTYLEAIGNMLSLKVSLNWVPPFQLSFLHLDSWQIGPQFPLWVQTQKSLNVVRMSNVGISGTIPSWLWNTFPSCYSFNLSNNHIHGDLDQLSTIVGRYPDIELGSNQFSGPLPLISSNITGIDLSNNSFSGSMSHFLCDKSPASRMTQLLNFQSNHLSGEIPDCWMYWPKLSLLNLQNNELMGNFPSSIGLLSDLRSLHVRNNHIQGELPTSLRSCTKLIFVDLSENKFVGSIPNWVGERLTSMVILILRSNMFYGHIPVQLCALTSLQIFDVAHNNLSGSIPRCLNNLTAMTTGHVVSWNMLSVYISTDAGDNPGLEDVLLTIKGTTYGYSSILGLMAVIDLSNNSLSGEIPKELTSLTGLLSLNLSNNLLTGQIPDTIGVMHVLESIDFSQNQLSGPIPSSMSTMTFLGHLNLSNNNLVGQIPLSTQLQSFGASSFSGNELCGRPVTNSCSITGVPTNVKSQQDREKEDAIEVELFYGTMAIGFIVGVWLVLAPLMFSKSWRLAYFRSLDSLWQRICHAGCTST